MSGTIFHPFVLDNAAGQETVVGIGSDQEKYGVGISSDTHITGIQTVTGFLHAGGGIKDTSGDMGSSGQVLSSTGSGLNWINPGEANVASASNVGTNDASSTNSTHYLAFLGATSGNNPVRIDTGLTYNPSSNVLTVGTIAATNIQGTLTAGGAIPQGGIILWSGAADAIPSGFALCDGSGSTPDLRGKFVVGYSNTDGDYDVGDSGGNKSTTLATTNLPSHSHPIGGNTGSQNLTHNHGYQSANHPTGSGPEQNQSGGPEDRTTFNVNKTTGNNSGNLDHSHTLPANTGNTGSGTAFENRPPYYALAYIMKT